MSAPHPVVQAEGVDVGSVKALGVTEDDLGKIMAKNDSWPFPGSDDGWVHVHDAIRMDMRDMTEALAACVNRGKMEPWMVANIQKWWKVFEINVLHHHDAEERIVFPGLAKIGCVMPPKMSADHEHLIKSMAATTQLVQGLSKAGPDIAAITALKERFEVLREEMTPHLQEEEDIGLPLMRKSITYKQFKPIEKKIIAEATSDHLGWFLRPFPTDTERRRWMTEIACIPGPVQALIMMPAAKRFRNDVARLLFEMIEGDRIPPEPTGCCGM